jgi:hypothetical protein
LFGTDSLGGCSAPEGKCRINAATAISGGTSSTFIASISALPNPIRDFIGDKKSLARTRFKPRTKRISVHFEWNAIVSAAAEKSPDVQF